MLRSSVSTPAHTAPRRRWAALALVACAGFAQAAEVPPVLPGLWEVTRLVTVAPGSAPAAQEAVSVEPGPKARSYRLCISPERARAPMAPGRLPRGAELMLDGSSMTGQFAEVQSAAEPRQVEFGYRRLDARSFEGSFDVSTAGGQRRAQYLARHLSPDCEGVAARAMLNLGEP